MGTRKEREKGKKGIRRDSYGITRARLSSLSEIFIGSIINRAVDATRRSALFRYIIVRIIGKIISAGSFLPTSCIVRD